MHYDRQVKQIEDHSIVYELSPRLGTSFGGTWRALLACNLITSPWMCNRLHPTRPLLLFGPTWGTFLISLLVPALSVRLRTRIILSHLRRTHRSQLTCILGRSCLVVGALCSGLLGLLKNMCSRIAMVVPQPRTVTSLYWDSTKIVDAGPDRA